MEEVIHEFGTAAIAAVGAALMITLVWHLKGVSDASKTSNDNLSEIVESAFDNIGNVEE